MREIKFRFHYSNGKDRFSRIFDIIEIMNGEPFDVLSDNPLLSDYKMLDEKDQFTGLHDKAGKEIYEWDICIHHPTGKIYIVKYSEGMFYPDNKYLQGYSLLNINDSSIIGNVWDNPDLKERT